MSIAYCGSNVNGATPRAIAIHEGNFMSQVRGYPNSGAYKSNIFEPVKIDCNFVVDHTNGNGLGIRSLKSNGYVRNVFMNTSASPGTNDNYTNPNPAAGIALIQMKMNYRSYLGGFSGFVSPTTGSTAAISGGTLTAHAPYIIATVGAVPKPSFTVATIADSSGSLASKYLTISDAFSNNYVLWFQVSGVGAAPSLTGPLNGYVAVPVSISTNDTNTTVANDLSTVIAALNGSASFTTSVGGHTVTVTSAANANLTLSPLPQAQTSGFTVSGLTYTSLATDWQSVGLQPGLVLVLAKALLLKILGVL